MGFSDAIFRRQLFRNAFRGFLGLTVATPIIAILQGKYLLSDFRKHHRDAPFPNMPCSGVVVVHPLPQDKSQQQPQQPDKKPQPQQVSTTWLSSGAKIPKPQYTTSSPSSWFSSFPLLRQQKDPDPLRLLVVGDSLAAGVGVTKSGTPVLPEAIAKSLSSALGGRAVYWTCMGEPGLSSPQIVKELLLAEVDEENSINGDEKIIDVMEELKEWWQKRRQQQEDREKELNSNQQQQTDDEAKTGALPAGPAKNVRLWWKRTVQGAQKDIQGLREKIHWQELGKSVRKRLRISTHKIPEPLVMLPPRRNTVVPDLVAQYDVAVVITGFNDLKNLIFPLPEDTNMDTTATIIREEREQENTNDGVWFERDLWKIMEALKGRMRNYGVNNKRDSGREEADAGNNSTTDCNSSDSYSKNDESTTDSSIEVSSMRHHPMVVFPAAPLYSDPPMPLSLFAAPIVKLMEKQKKKLAEKYPAPVLFLEAPDKKAISDFRNKRGPLWEARSKEEVLFELTNKARLEQLETLMKEYYDMWTVDVEEEEPTYTYDDWGPDIQGPLQHLHRSPLISPDNVHPSDEGYELWGRYIADGIIAEWQKDDAGQ